MSGGEEALECGSGGLWTLRGGVKVGAGGRVKTVSLFQPQFTFTHTGNHLQFQLEACDIRNLLITNYFLLGIVSYTVAYVLTYIARLLFRVLM